MRTTTEQAVKLGNHFIGLARELASRFDLSSKSVVEAAITEYHAKYANAPMLTISRIAEPSPAYNKPDAPLDPTVALTLPTRYKRSVEKKG